MILLEDLVENLQYFTDYKLVKVESFEEVTTEFYSI